MTRYILDTNTVSYLIKGLFPSIRRHVNRRTPGTLCISAITEAELRYGLARRPEARNLHSLVEQFLRHVDIPAWDSLAAQRYGNLRAALERGGRTLSRLDLLIAAHALSLGAILVTNDRAFLEIEHLPVVDWTKE
jgi:tRNA(fMet)-specific endonuclease VapC